MIWYIAIFCKGTHMSKPRKRYSCVLGLLLLCLISCGHPTEQSRYPIVSAENLLLTAEPFPTSWEADPCATDCDSTKQYGKAMRVFGRPKIAGHVIQQVTNYVYERSAKGEFQRAREITFPKRAPNESPFISAPPITYTSSIADDYHFGCGIDIVPACSVLARYSNYYIEIYFDIDGGDGDGLQIVEVQPILEALDTHVASQLGIELP